MRNYLKLCFAFIALSISVTSCKKDIGEGDFNLKTVDKYKYNVVFEWNDLFFELDKNAPGYRPGPVASVLGYIGLANYEATITGMPQYKSLSSQYNDLSVPKAFENQEYHWPTVVNAVNNYLYTRLFPQVETSLFNKIKALNFKNEIEFQKETNLEIYSRSKNYGESVGSAFWEWMKKDPVTFDAYKDPFGTYSWEERFKKNGDYVATVPGPGKAMFPFWGKGKLLAIKEDMRLCRPFTSYAPFSENPSSGFYAQAVEIMAQNTPSLSYQSQWIGEFWSDDLVFLTFSPPSRFLAIANQVYHNEKASLQEAIVCNAKVGLALHDASIGCWNSKYVYNLERPESYIKRVIDPSWEPNLNNPLNGQKGISPAFPAYPSGHSTFGAAAAEAMASVFGYNYGMTDNCHKNRTEFKGYPRTFSSFYDMAAENAWSRIPLGVHFRMDAEEGMRYGTEIGRAVNRLPWKK